MIYGYIRVSTDKQTCENQKLEIKKYCKIHRMRNIKFIAETTSGTKKVEKRRLGELLEVVKAEDTIIITELSRLGRSMIMILDVLQILLEKNVRVIAIKEGYELGDNIQSKILAFAFGLSAEIERNLISERTKQGLARVRKEGRHIGRNKGVKNKKLKLSGKGAYISRQLETGRSKRGISIELGVTWSTLDRFIKQKRISC